MTDEPGLAPPSRELIEEAGATALAALRITMGDLPVEVATAGELAALLDRVPADTALVIDEHVRIDPDLDEATTESRQAVQATAVAAFADEPVMAVGPAGGLDVYMRPIAAVMLGGILVAQDEAHGVSTHGVAYGAAERITEALHDADGARMLDAMIEIVGSVAGYLDGVADASLHEWLTDKDLAAQLEVEGNRLRQSAARLATLRERVAADLTVHGPPADDQQE